MEEFNTNSTIAKILLANTIEANMDEYEDIVTKKKMTKEDMDRISEILLDFTKNNWSYMQSLISGIKFYRNILNLNLETAESLEEAFIKNDKKVFDELTEDIIDLIENGLAIFSGKNFVVENEEVDDEEYSYIDDFGKKRK